VSQTAPRNIAYLYPWDVVGDPAAAERVASLGVDTVALAANYHSVRAATPYHPAHRLVDARHAAIYTRYRPRVWAGLRLTPGRPDWVAGDDPFGAARDALRAAGLAVHAWLVLAHDTRVGTDHARLAVRDAYEHTHRHAPCPAQPDVAYYLWKLAAEVMECAQADGVVLESAGPMGAVHAGRHEKTDGADWPAVVGQLLSLCFCAACRRRYASAGVDPDLLAARVRDALRPDVAPPADVDEALGDTADAVRGSRTALAAETQRRVLDAVGRAAPNARVTLHGNPDPWATGAFATVAGGIDPRVHAVVANAWDTDPRVTGERISALRRLASAGTAVGAYLLALPPWPADADRLRAAAADHRAHGATELHLYHAGLASPGRLDALRAVVAANRDDSTPQGGAFHDNADRDGVATSAAEG
jgi:hypothetical protein